MKINHILEGIRTGSKELASVPLDKYTIGFEFEVAVKPGYEVEGEVSGDVAPEDEMFAQEEAFEQFSNEWMNEESNEFFQDWIRDEYRNNFSKLVDQYDLEPRYGNPESEEEIADWFNRRLNEKYTDEQIKEANRIMDFDVEDASDEEITDAVFFDYSVIRGSRLTHEEVIEKIGDLRKSGNDERIEQAFKHHIREIRKEFEVEDFDLDSAVYDEDGNLVDVDLQVSDIEDLMTLYDIEYSDLKEMTEDEWTDQMMDRMQEDFSDWWMNNRERFVQSGDSAIVYVQEQIFNNIPQANRDGWKVVPDDTSGVDAEIVTTEYPVDRGLDFMHDVLDLINDDEYMETTSATGLHVNIGTFKMDDIESIDWLKFMVITNAKRMLDEFGRAQNGFALDKLPGFIARLDQGTFDNYQDTVRDFNRTILALSTKYSAINFSKLVPYGYFEVRAPGNVNYEHKGEKLEEYVRIILRAIEIARDPNAFKNQYIKKLYQLYDIEKQPSIQKKPRTAKEYMKSIFGSGLYTKSDPIEFIISRIRNINTENFISGGDSTLDPKVINDKLTPPAYMELVSDIDNELRVSMIDNPEEIKKWLEEVSGYPDEMKKITIVRILLKKLKEAVDSLD